MALWLRPQSAIRVGVPELEARARTAGLLGEGQAGRAAELGWNAASLFGCRRARPRACSGAVGPVLSRILVVPVCYGPSRAARQLPHQSTTLRVDSSSTDDSRLRGALPIPDSCTAPLPAGTPPQGPSRGGGVRDKSSIRYQRDNSKLAHPGGAGLLWAIHEPLVSYRINRQLSGWIPPPLMIRAFGAHCQFRTRALRNKAKLLRGC
jgi:hypothetical protein